MSLPSDFTVCLSKILSKFLVTLPVCNEGAGRCFKCFRRPCPLVWVREQHKKRMRYIAEFMFITSVRSFLCYDKLLYFHKLKFSFSPNGPVSEQKSFQSEQHYQVRAIQHNNYHDRASPDVLVFFVIDSRKPEGS